MEERNYKVYCHTNKINGKKYIGITCQSDPNKRWVNGHGYSKESHLHFRSAINKYGWDNFEHEILFEGLTSEEAFAKEIELIAFYDTTNQDKGYNISHGGNAPMLGRKHTEEAKQKFSETRKGKNNAFYGHHHTEETNQKNRDRVKEMLKDGMPDWMINNIESFKKAVNQYDLDGNFIQQFESTREAERQTGVHHRDISKVCNRKRCGRYIVKMAGGYQWRYVDDCDDITKYYDCIKKAVYEIDKNNNIIKEYESITSASIDTNIDSRYISNVCHGKHKSTKGRYFVFVKDYVVN